MPLFDTHLRPTTSPYAAQFLVMDEAAGDVKALRPVGEVEFVLAPRELPELMALDARLDSSLKGPLAALHAPGGSKYGCILLLSSSVCETLAPAQGCNTVSGSAAACRAWRRGA